MGFLLCGLLLKKARLVAGLTLEPLLVLVQELSLPGLGPAAI